MNDLEDHQKRHSGHEFDVGFVRVKHTPMLIAVDSPKADDIERLAKVVKQKRKLDIEDDLLDAPFPLNEGDFWCALSTEPD